MGEDKKDETTAPAPPKKRTRRDRISGAAVGALVSGILGFIACPVVMSIIAIVLGRGEIDAIDHGSSGRPGRTLASAGFALGIMGLIFWGIVGLAFLVWYIIVEAGRTLG